MTLKNCEVLGGHLHDMTIVKATEGEESSQE